MTAFALNVLASALGLGLGLAIKLVAGMAYRKVTSGRRP